MLFNDPRRNLISLPDDGPMRSKHVAGNKYSIVKYCFIINHFVVTTANLIIRSVSSFLIHYVSIIFVSTVKER
jgi:hypothetical protein